MKTARLVLLAGALYGLCSCSRGGASPDEPSDGTADLAGALDMAAAPVLDMAAARLDFLVPAWVFTQQGSAILWGPFVAALPASSDGQVVVAFTKANEADPLVVGPGDPGETTVPGAFKPVLVWLGGKDGRVQRVRRIAGDQSATQRASVLLQAGISATAAGDLLAGGQFHGYAMFNPDSVAATSQFTESQLVAGTLHRAEDPYVLRYAADGAPVWYNRGRTPGPLTKTWFNYCQGLAALPDGGALVAGLFEDANFVFGANGAGAVTLRQIGGGGYVARLNSQGGVAWLGRNTSGIAFWRGVRAGADGAGYLLGSLSQPSVTLLADTDKVVVPSVEGQRTWALIKLNAAGGVAWVRRLAFSGTYGPGDFTATPDGGVVLTGSTDKDLTVFAEGDKVAGTLTGTTTQAWVARWAADGSFSWLRALGTDVPYGTAVVPARSGDVWVAARTAVTTRQLELDGAPMVQLPMVALADADFTLLYRISAAGKRLGVDVVGVNLPVSHMTPTADGGLAMAGVYGDWVTDILVGGGGGTVRLPASEKGKDQRLFVLALRPR